jgi:hypothetical protein
MGEGATGEGQPDPVLCHTGRMKIPRTLIGALFLFCVFASVELALQTRSKKEPNGLSIGTVARTASSLDAPETNKPEVDTYLGGRLFARPDGEVFTSPPDDGPPVVTAPRKKK